MHVPADKVTKSLLRMSWLTCVLFMDGFIISKSMLFKSHELLIVLTRKLQPSFMNLLERRVMKLLQFFIDPIFA